MLLLAVLPAILLLGVQKTHGYSVSSGLIAQFQIAASPWIPEPLREFVISRPRVTVKQGTVVGVTLWDTLKNPIDAFRGIPYALPPLGERRFRSPVAIERSDDVLDASQFGARCPGKQLLKFGGDSHSSEDCLTVNVFRPHGTNGKKLPVAVYVHGGAYNRGTSSMHNTASMVGWSEEPFIGVSFNYRVGALGFLPSTITAEEGVLNLGLRDQILLFQWIQENIEAFGGDPSQVTLFGLSAGAHSIAHHIMNLDTQGLFHRAIIESGSVTSRAVHPYNARLHEQQFDEFVQEAGCADHPVSEIMTCLRSQPPEAITSASFTIFDRYNPSVRWAFQPVIDGDLIKQRPIDAWHSGKWNRMPILTGFNTNEGTYYVPESMSTSDEFTSFFHTLLPAYTEKDLQKINKLYPDPALDTSSIYAETRNISVGAQYKRVEAAYGHYAYACPVRQTATLASTGQEAPIFLYRWALNKTVQGGANHGDQMAYETLNPEVREISESQEEIAGILHAYFTSFIVRADPNAIGGRYAHRPEWKAYDASKKSGKKIMIFGEGNDERAGGEGKGVAATMAGDEWSRRECDFWWTKSGIEDES
ncbi:putative extracellular lipase [Aspergillus ruber CBS 135680]|uniref:Carboxylic ester hydrolase n=1 Tax=Aspergillus ruber (strain CBS 135680) TaxID=1388766 RepID=A0A017SCJ5_ASPRC|nr:putative extracellular lipase [Aspergillus ruber CBS 135680]EYE94768.1 putative extracellular lipase [Aspergillus ruber CBS 135680]